MMNYVCDVNVCDDYVPMWCMYLSDVSMWCMWMMMYMNDNDDDYVSMWCM